MLLEINTTNNILLVSVLACVEKPSPENDHQIKINQIENDEYFKNIMQVENDENKIIDKWTHARQRNPY